MTASTLNGVTVKALSILLGGNMWQVVFLAKNGWHVFRQYTNYFSALRWAEYHKEAKNWKVLNIVRIQE